MSDDWQRWLTDEELKSYKCRELLPPPGGEVIEMWAKSVSRTREKLAMARGMLYSVKFGDFTMEELKQVLDDTGG